MSDIVNSLRIYIQGLERQVKKLKRELETLQQHHQCCVQNAPTSPPTDGRISERSNSEVILNHKSIQFIPYDHQHTTSKLSNNNPKWRKGADRLLEDVHLVPIWASSIQQRKSKDVQKQHASIIAVICGFLVQDSALKYGRQITIQAQDDPVIASAQAYAKAMKLSQGKLKSSQQLQYFRELVLVSLCATLESCNYSIDKINEILRLYISDSEDTNLKRLRNGAIWANHQIIALDTVLDGNATEWFLERIYARLTATYNKLTVRRWHLHFAVYAARGQ